MSEKINQSSKSEESFHPKLQCAVFLDVEVEDEVEHNKH